MPNSRIQTFADGHKRALVRPDLAPHFSFDWFEPDAWGDKAVPVANGGRGSAWFVSSAQGSWVLRHFSRGGLPGRIVRRSYLFLGHAKVRSVREFQLLEAMQAQELPVPTPVAAFYERRGASYRAALLIEKLEGATPLMQFQHPCEASLWHCAGQCIRRFHDQGVFHADLNANNILVSQQTMAEAPKVYLIDFDRGYYHADHRPAAPWKQANLARLERSVKKGTPELSEATRMSLLDSLISGYNDFTTGSNDTQ